MTETIDASPLAPPFGLDSDAFTAAFRQHAASVAVITADCGNGPVGLTAISVFSVSGEPALLIFSLSELFSSAPTIASADSLVVHLLGVAQLSIAELSATSEIDRFADTRLWARLDTGEPYFPSAATWIRGRVVNRVTAGTSTVITVHADWVARTSATPQSSVRVGSSASSVPP